MIYVHPCTICDCGDFDEDPDSSYGAETEQGVCFCGHVEDEHEEAVGDVDPGPVG